MAELLRIYEENPNPRQMSKVIDVLKSGGLVIYPTDTVYGLGCDITNIKALERIARIKGVKLEKSNFSFICHDLSNLSDYVKQIEMVVQSGKETTYRDSPDDVSGCCSFARFAIWLSGPFSRPSFRGFAKPVHREWLDQPFVEMLRP